MSEKTDHKSLLYKFFSKDVSDQELEILKSWLEKDPWNRQYFDRINKIWQETQLDRNNFDTEKIWHDLSSALNLGKGNTPKVLVMDKNRFRILVAAASLLLILIVGGLSYNIKQWRSRQLVNASTIIQTREGEKVSVYLPDSTRIFMNSGTKIMYSSGYNIKDRIIDLSGEAFFDVATNKEKPFIVRLGNMKISATGTRFNVLSYNNENRIETTLEEGKIHVNIDGRPPVDVNPGQQMVYYSKSGKAEVRDVTTEIYTSWKENKLRLLDTPLEESLRRIARRYNVTFEIRGNELLELKYTATFIDESINDVMQMLKAVSPIDYHIFNRMTVDEKKYLKPRIIVSKRNI